MNRIGIMQGRLTKPLHRIDIQFPLCNSREIANEFDIAKDIELDYIEWNICKGNPNLFLGDFYAQQTLKSLVGQFVPIDSICLDYLMDIEDIRNTTDLANNVDIVNWISNMASNIGCNLLIIPIHEKNMDFLILNHLTSIALERFKLKVAFEFLDVNSYTGINFINDMNYSNKLSFMNFKKIGCCFDIGNNCQKLGTNDRVNLSHDNIIKEMENYNKYNMLYHIHIKEKDTHGNTVLLGKGVLGEVGWRRIFKFLKKINYTGDFTLQVARGKDGKEIETVKEQIEFIKDLM